MRKIDAIVLIENTCQMYILDIQKVEQAGLPGLFSMFKEVADMHEMAKAMAGDTFRMRVGNGYEDIFTEQVETILQSEEAEQNFINLAITLNPDMAEEFNMHLRLAAAAQLAYLSSSMIQKMIKIGNAGVDMRDLFDDDYIYVCMKVLCGFDMVREYAEFLGDPFMSQTDFFKELVAISEARSGR